MEGPSLEDEQPVGLLRVIRSARGPEKDFLLYPGENVIGRRSTSTVILPFPSISRLHAIIKIPIPGWAPILCDCGSVNGSSLLRPRRPLYPWLYYQLKDQEWLRFAKVRCQYHHLGAPLLPDPQRPLTVEEPLRLPGMEALQLRGALSAEDSNEIEGDVIIHSDASDEGHLEKDHRLTGRDGNSNSEADINEEINFD